ncbi:MAG: hypothetical protein ACKO5W_05785, partial [Crocinitomicaceae bacterium]
MRAFFSFNSRIDRAEYRYSYFLTFILYLLTTLYSVDWKINGIIDLLSALPFLLPIQATVLFLFDGENIGLLLVRLILFSFISLQFIKRLNDLGYEKINQKRKFFYPFYFTTLLTLDLLEKIDGRSEMEETSNQDVINEKIDDQKEYLKKVNENVRKTLVYVGIF